MRPRTRGLIRFMATVNVARRGGVTRRGGVARRGGVTRRGGGAGSDPADDPVGAIVRSDRRVDADQRADEERHDRRTQTDPELAHAGKKETPAGQQTDRRPDREERN